MITGRVWKFGDNINTDLMLPGSFIKASEDQQKRAVFAANRPGWVDLVQVGDIVVGGKNYGVGSSRPAARSLRNLGIACLLADSINGLFMRNAVNYGFLALECPGVHSSFREGETVDVSVENWTVRNQATGVCLRAIPVPSELMSLMSAGGIYPLLQEKGWVGALLSERYRSEVAAGSPSVEGA